MVPKSYVTFAGGPRAKHASKMSRDDDSDSLPDLMDDEELTSTSAAPPVGRDARSPRDARSTTSTRAVRHASSASVEGVDTIFNVDSDSDGKTFKGTVQLWKQLMLAGFLGLSNSRVP